MLTGLAAAQHAGPAIVLSFIIAGIGCVFAGLCYAEFASMMPVSGSAYAYSYATLGEGVAWFIGWNLVLEYLFAASTVAVGWSGYFDQAARRAATSTSSRRRSRARRSTTRSSNGFFATGALFNLPAVLIVAVVTVILVLGIRQSALVNAIVVAIKVGIVVLVIGFGAFYVNRRQLASVHSGEHRRVGPVRLERRHPRLRHHVLRLHRLRRGLHRGAGSEESAARHADRHSRLARHLHGAVHADVRRADRHARRIRS